jgi:Xaa-Pro dipeptidase
MHRLAERIIIRHLLKIGILHNGTEDEMMQHNMASIFMPHGLGHLLGMACHDVGGYTKQYTRSSEPGLKWLRLGRKLEKGMVLTVEPGI